MTRLHRAVQFLHLCIRYNTTTIVGKVGGIRTVGINRSMSNVIRHRLRFMT
jgi:hypothetical protein